MLCIYVLALVACLVQLEVGTAETSSITQQKRDAVAGAVLSSHSTDAENHSGELAKTRELVLPTTTSQQKRVRRAPDAKGKGGKGTSPAAPLNPPAQFQQTRRSLAAPQITVILKIDSDSSASGDEDTEDCTDAEDESTSASVIKHDLPAPNGIATLLDQGQKITTNASSPTKLDLPAPFVSMLDYAMTPEQKVNTTSITTKPTRRYLAI